MKLIVLKCTWTDCKSTRTIAVPPSFTLEQLHFALQDAFGWDEEHLYGFKDGQGNRWTPEPDFDDETEPGETTVGEVFSEPSAKLEYEYDFGDDNLVLIRRLKKEIEGDLPVCLAATGFMAVEDSSAFGFVDGIAEILRTGPEDKSYGECAEWLGIESPEEAQEWLRDQIADPEEINETLAARFAPRRRKR